MSQAHRFSSIVLFPLFATQSLGKIHRIMNLSESDFSKPVTGSVASMSSTGRESAVTHGKSSCELWPLLDSVGYSKVGQSAQWEAPVAAAIHEPNAWLNAFYLLVRVQCFLI